MDCSSTPGPDLTTYLLNVLRYRKTTPKTGGSSAPTRNISLIHFGHHTIKH